MKWISVLLQLQELSYTNNFVPNIHTCALYVLAFVPRECVHLASGGTQEVMHKIEDVVEQPETDASSPHPSFGCCYSVHMAILFQFVTKSI